MRVIMSDEEKKEKCFAGFNPRSAQWNSVKTFWMQSNHTFDDLSRGVQQQHSLDAVEAEDNASGVRSFMAKSMRDEERNNECDYDRFNKRTKRDEESAHAHYTARGAGGKGGKSGNGVQTCRGVQVHGARNGLLILSEPASRLSGFLLSQLPCYSTEMTSLRDALWNAIAILLKRMA